MKKIASIILLMLVLRVSAQIPSDSLALWLRSDSGLVLSGTDVIQWNDLSGNARHASTISASYPQLVPNEICGKPVLRFNGSSTYMLCPAFATFPSMRGTIYVIVRVNGAGNGAAGYGTFVSIFMPGEWQFGSYSTNSYAFYDGSNGSNIPFATSPPSNWGILALNRSYDDTLSFYKNGAFVLNDDVAVLQPSPNTFKIGSRGDAYEVLNGDIAEIIVYNKSQSPAEMYQVNSYLANKYCLNSNVAVPLASAQSRCGPGSLTLSASGGVHYRWYDDLYSSTILDTNAVYTTPPLASTDTFYVANYNDTLESVRTMVIATVHPLPAVSLNLAAMDTVCYQSAPILLTGGSPAGGTYSGTGVTDTVFDPQTAGPGQFYIYYTWTDSNSCVSSDSSMITVDVCAGYHEESEVTVRAYPNPASENIYLTSSKEIRSINCFSMTGQCVQNYPAPNQISLAGLSSGIYFLEIIYKDETSSYIKIRKE